MDTASRKYLLQRVIDVCPVLRRQKVPIEIVRAQTLLEKYEGHCYRRRQRFNETVKRAKDRARELIFAGDYMAAVEAVRKLEREDFNEPGTPRAKNTDL